LAAAQDTDYAGHPLIGTWTLVVDGEAPEMVIFSDTGGYVDVESADSVVLGVWEPTGDTTANLTITGYDEELSYRIRGSIEVAADGQSLTASYTFEPFNPQTGEGMGEYGPGTVTGTRMVAEAPGTPVGSIEDLFSLFGGTPEASPVP
jgi:hypothetical protein